MTCNDCRTVMRKAPDVTGTEMLAVCRHLRKCKECWDWAHTDPEMQAESIDEIDMAPHFAAFLKAQLDPENHQ